MKKNYAQEKSILFDIVIKFIVWAKMHVKELLKKYNGMLKMMMTDSAKKAEIQ